MQHEHATKKHATGGNESERKDQVNYVHDIHNDPNSLKNVPVHVNNRSLGS